MLSLIQRLASRPAASASNDDVARDERLRAAFAAVPVGLALCGLDGRWLLFNDAAAEVLGYSRQELSGMSLHELTHPADVPRETAFLRRLQAGEVRRYRIEKRMLDGQAKYREVVVTAAMVRNRAGIRDAIVYAIEKALPREESGRTADALNQQILDSLTDIAVIRCDARGTIVGWNRGAQQLFGYSRDEIAGRNRRALYRDGENWSEAAQEDLRVAEARRVLETEDFRRARDGRELWVHVSLTAFAPDGVLRGFAEVVRPVADAHWVAIDAGGALGAIEAVSRSARNGLLTFVSGSRQKSIQLVDGAIASCASNDPAQAIGDRLVRGGAITEGQRKKAVELAAATNVAIGRALVILGILSEEDVASALREKIEDEIAELATWDEGRWTFVDREPPRVKPIRASLALSELRAFKPDEFVASRTGTRYHRESCTAMLRVRDHERVPVVSALTGAQRGLVPCRICISSL